MEKITKKQFYILSFTWGIIVTLAGLVVAGALFVIGKRPARLGWGLKFEIGKRRWGGVSLGLVYIMEKNPTERIKYHEAGHGIQNCYFGPFMLIIVNLPSTLRYWFRTICEWLKIKLKTQYDDIWFEGQATQIGTLVVKRIETEQ